MSTALRRLSGTFAAPSAIDDIAALPSDRALAELGPAPQAASPAQKPAGSAHPTPDAAPRVQPGTWNTVVRQWGTAAAHVKEQPGSGQDASAMTPQQPHQIHSPSETLMSPSPVAPPSGTWTSPQQPPLGVSRSVPDLSRPRPVQEMLAAAIAEHGSYAGQSSAATLLLTRPLQPYPLREVYVPPRPRDTTFDFKPLPPIRRRPTAPREDGEPPAIRSPPLLRPVTVQRRGSKGGGGGEASPPSGWRHQGTGASKARPRELPGYSAKARRLREALLHGVRPPPEEEEEGEEAGWGYGSSHPAWRWDPATGQWWWDAAAAEAAGGWDAGDGGAWQQPHWQQQQQWGPGFQEPPPGHPWGGPPPHWQRAQQPPPAHFSPHGPPPRTPGVGFPGHGPPQPPPHWGGPERSPPPPTPWQPDWQEGLDREWPQGPPPPSAASRPPTTLQPPPTQHHPFAGGWRGGPPPGERWHLSEAEQQQQRGSGGWHHPHGQQHHPPEHAPPEAGGWHPPEEAVQHPLPQPHAADFSAPGERGAGAHEWHRGEQQQQPWEDQAHARRPDWAPQQSPLQGPGSGQQQRWGRGEPHPLPSPSEGRHGYDGRGPSRGIHPIAEEGGGGADDEDDLRTATRTRSFGGGTAPFEQEAGGAAAAQHGEAEGGAYRRDSAAGDAWRREGRDWEARSRRGSGSDAHGYAGSDAHGYTGSDAHGYTGSDAHGYGGSAQQYGGGAEDEEGEGRSRLSSVGREYGEGRYSAEEAHWRRGSGGDRAGSQRRYGHAPSYDDEYGAAARHSRHGAGDGYRDDYRRRDDPRQEQQRQRGSEQQQRRGESSRHGHHGSTGAPESHPREGGDSEWLRGGGRRLSGSEGGASSVEDRGRIDDVRERWLQWERQKQAQAQQQQERERAPAQRNDRDSRGESGHRWHPPAGAVESRSRTTAATRRRSSGGGSGGWPPPAPSPTAPHRHSHEGGYDYEDRRGEHRDGHTGGSSSSGGGWDAAAQAGRELREERWSRGAAPGAADRGC